MRNNDDEDGDREYRLVMQGVHDQKENNIKKSCSRWRIHNDNVSSRAREREKEN